VGLSPGGTVRLRRPGPPVRRPCPGRAPQAPSEEGFQPSEKPPNLLFVLAGRTLFRRNFPEL